MPTYEARRQPHVLPEEFDRLADYAAREVEGLRLELIGGSPVFKPRPDGRHTTVTAWLARQCMERRPEWGLHVGLGLRVGAARDGRAVPDATLLPVGRLPGSGQWADPEGVLMTAEVTRGDWASSWRNRVEKPRAYAEAGIPVYLLVDLDTCRFTVHSRLEQGTYALRLAVPFGQPLPLPDPVGMELDTQQLLSWSTGNEG
ncbi:Uma2 family endonuclease [Streptomyces sp. NPDC021020]|uniref:Uma2 family endonuclease n=1 Tax=Streptomyces sp. NPDC021020 TaxID=3365109 RepID=UPI0037B4BF4E